MIDSFNPLIKMLITLLVSLLLGFSYDYQLNMSIVVICIALLCTSKTLQLKHVLLIIVPVLLMCTGMFFTGYKLSNPNSEAVQNLKNIIISPNITMGIVLSSRILAFAMTGMLFVLTTDKVLWVYSLMKYVKFPPSYAYGLLIAVNLLPMIKREFKHCKLALQNRNNGKWSYTTVLVNMLIQSIRWSEITALSMEAKGFQDTNRSYYFDPCIRMSEIIALVVCVAAVIYGLL